MRRCRIIHRMRTCSIWLLLLVLAALLAASCGESGEEAPVLSATVTAISTAESINVTPIVRTAARPAPTSAQAPQATALPTSTQAPQATLTPNGTSTPSPTPVPPAPTLTPTPEPTATADPNPTSAPSPAATRTLTHTATPSPAPTPTPSGPLYTEDFEDGLAQNWALETGWQVSREDGNTILLGRDHRWANFNEGSQWTNYAFMFRLKVRAGSVHLNYRLGEAGQFTRYFLSFNEGGLALGKQVGDEFTHISGIQKFQSPNTWHTVEIKGFEGHLQVFVDGLIELDVTEVDPCSRERSLSRPWTTRRSSLTISRSSGSPSPSRVPLPQRA